MIRKAEVVINSVIVVLTLVLTIAYAVDGNAIAIMFGIIMLLNCIALFLRAKNRNNK